jgi:outer membrane protein W
MYSGSLLAQYHILLQNAGISPFIGLGIGHRESQTGDGDTAFMFPLGASFALPVGNELSIVGTLSFNIHDIELDGEEDAASAGLTFGINYMP